MSGNYNHNWVIWWRMLRLFFIMFIGGFALAVPGIVLHNDVLGGLAGLSMGTAFVGLFCVGMYTVDNRVPWDVLTEKPEKIKLTRADRKELAKEKSRINLESTLRELERKNNINGH